MKKSHPHLFSRLLCGLLLLLIQQIAYAQVPLPADWDTFISSDRNTIIRDTFRLQSFEGTAKDDWKYEADEGCSILDADEAKITALAGKQFFQLPPNKEIRFEHYSLDKYSETRTRLKYKREGLSSKDKLWIFPYRPTDTQAIELSTPDETVRSTPVGNGSPGIDIFTKSTTTTGGYYCIDSVYAFGNICLYSRFTQKGAWNDTARWSHLPAARHRRALLSGEVVVETDVECNELHIGNGSLTVAPQGSFRTKNITVHRTFAEKGCWYLLSFPFDIYPDGTDPLFKHGSSDSNLSGNYFYVLSYNGEQRATSANNEGNWEVCSPESIPNGEPLFHRNKGYLIALDAGATIQTLRFTARPDDITNDFGKSGSVAVKASLSADSRHSGWYLCGNPLPAPLSLTQIADNPDLDGNIYVYNGSTYTAYALGSHYALPPFAAFFVKASADTELVVTADTSPALPLLSGATLPLLQPGAAPTVGAPTGVSRPMVQQPQSRICGNSLCLTDLPCRAEIRLLSFDGRLIRTYTAPAGSSVVSLPPTSAPCLLHIHAGSYIGRHKVGIK